MLLALPAPAFEALDTQGRWFDLAALRGRPVVLEWINPDCPPWRIYYAPPFLQERQRRYAERGVAWVWICSRRGVSSARLNALAAELGASPTCILADGSGRLARLYAPRATPHVFLLGPDQTVRYQGAVDDGEQRCYLDEALDAVLNGQSVPTPATSPFG